MDLIFTIALLCQVHPSIQDIIDESYKRDLSQMVCQDWYLTCVESANAEEDIALKKCIKARLQKLKK